VSAGQHHARVLRRKEAAHDTHTEHHKRQQHEHFRGVVDEECDRIGEMGSGLQRKLRGKPSRERFELSIKHKSGSEQSDRSGDPQAAVLCFR
jgi:hypothetical protein